MSDQCMVRVLGDRCAECGSANIGVIDSRPAAAGQRRRRRCFDCNQKWTTIEISLTQLDRYERALIALRNITAAVTAAQALMRQSEPDVVLLA